MQNLFEQAKKCFLIANPDEKMAATYEVAQLWQANKLEWSDAEEALHLDLPGQLDSPEIVAPGDVPKRKPNSEIGRAALIHALAHIELTAVNLAWDTIIRYPNMPKEYFDDWVNCAQEEASHFEMLRKHLQSMGYDYGSFPVHAELWKMAVTTAADLADRMAVVHRVFEARALDVIPGTLKRFEQRGDTDMVKILNIICNEEIGHVSSGTKWFHYRCHQKNIDPDQTFIAMINKYLKNPLPGPFNYEARMECGFTDIEMQFLESQSPHNRRK